MATFKRYNGTSWETIGVPSVNSGPASTLGYAQVTVDQTGISSEVNLTNLQVTVTVPEGRRLRITGHSQIGNDATAGLVLGRIYEGATELGRWVVDDIGASGFVVGSGSIVISPTAGTHTYNLKLWKFSGAGTVFLDADPTFPAYILVEDITGSTLPYNAASVPVGRLGYAERLTDQGSITARVPVTGLTTNVAVPAGRSVHVTFHGGLARTVADGVTRLFIMRDGATIQFKDYFVRGALEGHVGMEFSVVDSPSAGAHVYSIEAQQVTGTGTSTIAAAAGEPAFILVEDITATPTPSSGAPNSTLGYAEAVANQTGITTEVDATGLVVNVNVPAGRRLKLTASAFMKGTVTDTTSIMRIKEGGTILNMAQIPNVPANIGNRITAIAVITPSAGAHTYKVSLEDFGGGTGQMDASSLFPAFLLVEDITGSIWPEGETVTTGLIASEPWTAWSPVITQGVTPTQTVQYARYVRIGRLIIADCQVTFTAAGTAANSIVLSGLPVAADAASPIMGSFHLFDVGNTNFVGTPLRTTTTTVHFLHDGDGNALGIGTPTIANGDVMRVHCMYEAAS